MDSAALYKLAYADLQKLAKVSRASTRSNLVCGQCFLLRALHRTQRDGVRANQRKADIVAELLKKHHPMLVPL